ncbi:MAG: RDD family protein, partial [Chloroflexi bacterium]
MRSQTLVSLPPSARGSARSIVRSTARCESKVGTKDGPGSGSPSSSPRWTAPSRNASALVSPHTCERSSHSCRRNSRPTSPGANRDPNATTRPLMLPADVTRRRRRRGKGDAFMSVQAASAALAPASIGARVVAYIIDGLILFVVGLLVVGSLIGDQTVTGNVIRAIIYALLGFVYFGYTWTAWRASPGQRILGLVTVNADDGAA